MSPPTNENPKMTHPKWTIFLQSKIWKIAVEKDPISANMVPTKIIAMMIWTAYKNWEKYLVKYSSTIALSSSILVYSWWMYMLSIFWVRTKLFFMVSAELSKNLALSSIACADSDSFYVTLSACSMYVVIVLFWPTGPSPLLMNSESIKGAGNPALSWV